MSLTLSNSLPLLGVISFQFHLATICFVQFCNTVLSTIITIVYVRSSDFPHLIAENVCVAPNLSLFPLPLGSQFPTHDFWEFDLKKTVDRRDTVQDLSFFAWLTLLKLLLLSLWFNRWKNLRLTELILGGEGIPETPSWCQSASAGLCSRLPFSLHLIRVAVSLFRIHWCRYHYSLLL